MHRLKLRVLQCATDLASEALATQTSRASVVAVLKGFGSAGVLEVVEDDVGGTYRAVYTVKFEEAVSDVLHVYS